MTELQILVEGYARQEDDVWYASPSTVWLRDNEQNIIVDPGANKELLLAAMQQHSIEVTDIDIVFLTHYHLDHILNIRLFPEADIYDGCTMIRGDRICGYCDRIPGTDITVIATPGHADEHYSLLVETTDGKVAIAGDVIWWSEDEAQNNDRSSVLAREDPFVKDRGALRESREKLLAVADFIIPGHGKIFRVDDAEGKSAGEEKIVL